MDICLLKESCQDPVTSYVQTDIAPDTRDSSLDILSYGQLIQFSDVGGALNFILARAGFFSRIKDFVKQMNIHDGLFYINIMLFGI